MLTTNVIGYGNILRQDDGVGVRVVEELAKGDLPRGVTLIDAGTRSLDLCSFLEGARRAMIVDAVRNDAPPGTTYRVDLGEASVEPDVSACVALHDVGWEQALGMGRIVLGDAFPEVVTFFGVEVERTGAGIGLSAPILEAARGVARMIEAELAHGGDIGSTPGEERGVRAAESP